MAKIQLLLVAGVAASVVPRRLDQPVAPVCTRNTNNFVVDDLIGHPDRDDAGRKAFFPLGGVFPQDVDEMPKADFNYLNSEVGSWHQSEAVDKNVMIKQICTTAMCIEPGSRSLRETDVDTDESSESDGGKVLPVSNSGKVWTKPGTNDYMAELIRSISGIQTGLSGYGSAYGYWLLGVGTIIGGTTPFDKSKLTSDPASYQPAQNTGCCLQRGADPLVADCAYPLSKEQWYDTCEPYLCFMETCGSARGNSYHDGVACANDDDTK